jgi:hypothetical protein
VVRELTDLIAVRGKPGMIVSDNGTELTSNAVLGYNKWYIVKTMKPDSGQATRQHAVYMHNIWLSELSDVALQSSLGVLCPKPLK